MFQEGEQFFKEQANILAIKNNMALFDKGLEVYAVKSDGSVTLISKREDSNKIWDTALRNLKKMYNKRLFNYQ